MNDADASPDLAELARALLHRARAGVLATLSQDNAGWPFGSLAPFAVAADGSLILALSDLAEHTRNTRADPRASLFVQEPATSDAQSGARICVLGRVTEIVGAARDDARARYVARMPEARGFLDKLDFRLYGLAPTRVRLVGGFGRIAWLDGAAVARDRGTDPLAAMAAEVCTHMNEDHAEVLGLYCAAFRARAGLSPRMTGVDAWGFDLLDEATAERFRFDFESPVRDAEELRKAVVVMARAAREKLGLARGNP